MKQFLYLFGFLLFLGSCTLEDPAIGVDVSQIISLKAEKTTLLADGLDRATMTATLGALADANQEVTFSTESGRFAEAATASPEKVIQVASGKTAEATLISSTTVAEEVIVTANIQNFVYPLILTFERAYPEDLTIVADKQTVMTDRIDFAELSVELFRNAGFSSDNARIDFQVIQQDTATAEILPFAYTQGTIAVVNVKSGNGKPGNVIVKCTTQGVNGTTLERELALSFE